MRLNSIRLPHHAAASEKQTALLDTPKMVLISMSQHGGVPCTPVVNVGDYVKKGQKIGESTAYISAPIHASISGTVTDIGDFTSFSGKVNKAIAISAGDRQEMFEGIKPPEIVSLADFIEAIKESGLVGLGGAGFPTYVKLNYDRKTVHIDTLIINGAECEPYISSDYRELVENPEGIVSGIKLIMKYLEIKKAIIGIEQGYALAIEKMSNAIMREPNITIKTLTNTYPGGAEKVLIYKTTKRIVAEGKLPSTTGCMVLNCSTAAFIAEYVKTGIPLISRRITVDGNIVNKPKNLIVPIGTPLSDISAVANIRTDADRIIFGGPMMGISIYDMEYPTTKTNNAVLFFGETKVQQMTSCIRCGKCVRACSMKLSPTELEHAYDARDAELLKKLKVNLCVNCGACTFVCPAKRNISEKNQLAKTFLRESKA